MGSETNHASALAGELPPDPHQLHPEVDLLCGRPLVQAGVRVVVHREGSEERDPHGCSGGDSRTEGRKVGRSEYEKEWEGERRHPKVVPAADGNQGSPESRWKGWPVSGVS
jgi:hypothetical protein